MDVWRMTALVRVGGRNMHQGHERQEGLRKLGGPGTAEGFCRREL